MTLRYSNFQQHFEQKHGYLELQTPDTLCYLNINQVHQIVSLMALSAIPKTPHYLAGVFSYYGVTVPVIDLSLRLGGSSGVYSSLTNIVLSKTLNDESLLGLIVSDIGNVIEISNSDLQLAPQFPGKASPFSAIYQHQEKSSFILNMDALFNSCLTKLYTLTPEEVKHVIVSGFESFDET